MITVKRRLVSEEEVTSKLDALARRYHIPERCYDESSGEDMSEFDALKWQSLCSQLVALKRRDCKTASGGSPVPPRFRFIYGMRHGSQPRELENSCDNLSELAA